jgi:hypothetical protein
LRALVCSCQPLSPSPRRAAALRCALSGCGSESHRQTPCA